MENLPEELLMKIFQMVSREDLRNIVLVCRNWRQIGETPSLWSSLCISVNTSNVSVIPDILTMHRMSASTKLVIHGTVLSKEVTEAIVEHPGLKEVVVQPGNGIEIPLSVLSCISSPGCQVTRLDFSWNDLSGVDPGLLVKVVTKLETLKVRNTRLTQQQTAAIFTAVSEGNKIANLGIGGNDLSGVDLRLLDMAVIKLELLEIYGTNLTQKQIVAILTAVRKGSKITELDIGGNDLSGVDPELLVKTVTKLKMLDVTSTQLAPHQIVPIITAVTDGSNMTELRIAWNNLSQVDPGLLEKTVINLELLAIYRTNLTQKQIVAILHRKRLSQC